MKPVRFLVAVPTVRPSSEAIAILQRTCTLPTDLLVLNGTEGKAQVLNWTLENVLRPDRYDFYATIDDDYLAAPGWQEEIVTAFERIPRLGGAAIDLSFDPMGREVMAEIFPPVDCNGVQFREHTGKINICGALIVMPSVVAKEVGPIPILAGARYQYYEDGWRCQQLHKRGYRYGYLVCDCRPTLIEYADSPEFLKMKAADIAAAREVLHTVFDM